MPGYRLYSLRSGRTLSVEEIAAADDSAAVAAARAIRPGRDRELWCGGRIVASLPAESRDLKPTWRLR